MFHGCEHVLEVPRTGFGQTVPEHVVHDPYRALCTSRLKGRMEGGLVGSFADAAVERAYTNIRARVKR